MRATVYVGTREAKDRKVRDPEYLYKMKNPFAHPFAKFVLKKIFFYSVVAFVALNFIFLIPRLMPGNPIDQMIPPGTTDLGRLRLKAELGKYFGLAVYFRSAGEKHFCRISAGQLQHIPGSD